MRNLMQALAAREAVQANYFYGLAWSAELLSRTPAGVPAGSSLLKRWLPYGWELSRATQEIAFSFYARPGRFDLYHEPAFLLLSETLPAVVTVHDLSFDHYPETHPAGRVRVLRKRLPRSLDSARAIITDSLAVRDELIVRYGVAPKKIHAVHLGVSPAFRPQTIEVKRPGLTEIGLEDKRFLLAVGTLEPRKNLVRTLKAYAALPQHLRTRFPLVVVGAAGWHTSAIFAELGPLERRGEVRILGYVPEKQLAILYSGARALLYPSLYEGFGLPIVEAMASGTPVITSNVGCMREVAEGAAILVDPLDVNAISAGMQRLLEDDDEATRLRYAGEQRARKFSWTRCADETLAIYRRVLQE